MANMFDLTGKVALLTGASKGMGLAMAQGLAENGATVVISSRKQDQLDEAAAGINKAVGRDAAVGIACNIGYPEQVEALVAKTRSQVGPVDILVGNAGVNPYYVNARRGLIRPALGPRRRAGGFPAGPDRPWCRS